MTLTTFPSINPDYTFQEIPMFSTLIVNFNNNRVEQAKALDLGVQWAFKLSYNVLSNKEKEIIQQFFIARKGAHESFFFYHPQPSQVIGTNGLNYVCTLTHNSSTITKPILGGSYVTYWTQEGEDGIEWTENHLYKYGFIVRFKEDVSTFGAFNFNLWQNNLIELIECDIANAEATTVYDDFYISARLGITSDILFFSATDGVVYSESISNSKVNESSSIDGIICSETVTNSKVNESSASDGIVISELVNSTLEGILTSSDGIICSEVITNSKVNESVSSDGIVNSDTPDGTVTLAPTIFGSRGVFFYNSNTIEYITIASTGNSTDFGDSISGEGSPCASCSNGSRGVTGGGASNNTIQYITIASTGNSTDFGDLTVSRSYLAACSSPIRGVFGGGSQGGRKNVIDYITIASTGNSTDFGDLTDNIYTLTACSDESRGIFAAGVGNADLRINIISYITIASTGDATDFGDITTATAYIPGSCSSLTRGVFAGGNTNSTAYINVIEYITIASTGNSTDFGDLTVSRDYLGSCSDGSRGVFVGGDSLSDYRNIIDYITIASTGNATDFGDILSNEKEVSACSGT